MAAKELFLTPLFTDANLVSYWRFEGNSTDSKGSNTGTDTSMSYSSTNAEFGQAAVFNGSSSRIAKATPTGLPSGNSDFTITLWAYPTVDQSASISACVTWGAEVNNQMAGFGIGPSGVNGLYYLGFSNDAQVSWTYSPNTMYFICCTYTASTKTVQFYVNGAAQGTGQVLASTPNVGSTFLNLGTQRPGNLVYYQGNLDDAAIFSRLLTTTEISNLFNGTFSTSANLLTIGAGT